MTATRRRLSWDVPDSFEAWQNDVFKELLRQVSEQEEMTVTRIVQGTGMSDPYVRKLLDPENATAPGADFVGPIANFFAIQFNKPVGLVMRRLFNRWS